MKFLSHLTISVLFGLTLSSGVALAQGATGPTLQGGAQPPQPGAMGAMGGTGQSGAAQGSSAQGGCSMMRNMASLQERVRQLEQRAGIPSPAQPQ